MYEYDTLCETTKDPEGKVPETFLVHPTPFIPTTPYQYTGKTPPRKPRP